MDINTLNGLNQDNVYKDKQGNTHTYTQISSKEDGLNYDAMMHKTRQAYCDIVGGNADSNTDSLGTVDQDLLDAYELALSTGDIRTAVNLNMQIQKLLGYQSGEEVTKALGGDTSTFKEPVIKEPEEMEYNFDSYDVEVRNPNSIEACEKRMKRQMGDVNYDALYTQESKGEESYYDKMNNACRKAVADMM